MAEQTDYAAVLADLRVKREELDRMIVFLEQLAGLPSSAATIGLGTQVRVDAHAHAPNDIPSDAFFGMRVPEAVKKYLQMIKKKQTAAEIAKALVKGGLQHTAKNFYSNVYTVLLRHQERGDVVKIGNEWGLAAWYPGMRKPPAKTDSITIEAQSPANADASVETKEPEIKQPIPA